MSSPEIVGVHTNCKQWTAAHQTSPKQLGRPPTHGQWNLVFEALACPTYNSRFAKLQASIKFREASKFNAMGSTDRKKRVYTRRVKGIPPVRGETLGERAQIIRYYMTQDNKGQFAALFAKCPRSVWGQIENDQRDMSKAIEARIVKVVPGCSREFIRDNDRSRLGEGLAAIVTQAQTSAPPPTKGTRRTTRSA